MSRFPVDIRVLVVVKSSFSYRSFPVDKTINKILLKAFARCRFSAFNFYHYHLHFVGSQTLDLQVIQFKSEMFFKSLFKNSSTRNQYISAFVGEFGRSGGKSDKIKSTRDEINYETSRKIYK